MKTLCQVFSVNRSSYKYWRNRPNDISPGRVKLDSLVREAHAASHGSAGVRTIADIVSTLGEKLSRYRAARIMKRLGLVSCQMPKHSYKIVAKSM